MLFTFNLASTTEVISSLKLIFEIEEEEDVISVNSPINVIYDRAYNYQVILSLYITIKYQFNSAASGSSDSRGMVGPSNS